MPEKTAKAGQKFKVTSKAFEWTTEDGDTVTIPMRLKLKVIRGLSDKSADDVTTMFMLIDQIAPGQDAVLDEMDVNDFVACFTTWQAEYNALTGATPGE